MTDAVTLLRDVRPADPDLAPDEAVLERLLLAAPDPRPTRSTSGRRVARPLVLAGTAAVAVSLVVALTPPGPRHTPGLVDRAAAALSRPATIIHVRGRVSGAGARARTFDSWETTDGRLERQVVDGGALELTTDRDAGVLSGYTRDRNLVQDYSGLSRIRSVGERPRGIEGGAGFSGIGPVGDLKGLLARARSGDDRRVVEQAEQTLDGRRVGHLVITTEVARVDGEGRPLRRADGTPATVSTYRDVYLDPRTALPVRVVDRALTPSLPDHVVDYVVAEQLPLTPANQALLRLAPHPGATHRSGTLG